MIKVVYEIILIVANRAVDSVSFGLRVASDPFRAEMQTIPFQIIGDNIRDFINTAVAICG